jgi:outer membrane protein assembly factor BamB
VVDGDRVYIYGPKGILNCVRITDGEHLWRVDTFADFGVVANFFGVGSTPVIERDLLITQVGGSPPGSPHILTGRVKGKDSGIVAFDKYTGKVKYKITDELASYSSPVLATIDDRRWCFVFARGGLIGFEPASGKVDFRYPWREADPESVNASNPVIVGDLVFISETYGPGSSLLKVSPGKHEVLWKDDEQERARAMQTHWNTAIHHDGYLYACSGRNIPDAELRCIELATGKIMWRQPDQFLSPDRIRSSLLMVDGHFVCLDEDGKLRLLRINHEKYDLVAEMVPFRGRAELGAGAGDSANFIEFPAWAAPVLSHGLLYVRRVDELVCLELIPEMK